MLILLNQIRKNWKIMLILMLVSVIGFGGWYYTSSQANLEYEVVLLTAELKTSLDNEEELRGKISTVNDSLELLEQSNKKLETNVQSAQDQIDDLEAREPNFVTIKTIPAECQNKLDWLKKEVIKFKESMR